MIYLLLFIFGSIFGSFYLVLGMRAPQGEKITKPRSHCDHCQKTLKWYHLIPVFSYIFLGGKCSYCRNKIAPSNLITEIFTGLFFALSYFVYGYSVNTLISIITISILIITFISDFNYLIILDTPVILGSILVLILKYLDLGLKSSLMSLLSGALLFIIMLIIKLLGDKVFKKDSLGGGDIKLSIFIGILLGVKFGLISLVISCFIALPYAIYISFKEKEKEIPFGPFLIMAAFLVFLYLDKINEIINLILYF